LQKTNIFDIHIYVYHNNTLIKTETHLRNRTTNFIPKETMAINFMEYKYQFPDTDDDEDNKMQFDINDLKNSDNEMANSEEDQQIQFSMDDVNGSDDEMANFKNNSTSSLKGEEETMQNDTESDLDDNNDRGQVGMHDFDNCDTDKTNSTNSGDMEPSCNSKEEETMQIEGDKGEIERQLFMNIAVACMTQDVVKNLILCNKHAPKFDEFHSKYKSNANETKHLLYMHEVKNSQISFKEYCNAKKSKYEQEFLKKNPTVTALSYRKRCRESKRRSLKKIYMEQLMSYINSTV